MEAFYSNVFGTALFAMIVGRGNPLYYLIFVALHFPLVMLADRNPYFFHEWVMWLKTRAAIIGDVLHAYAPEGQSSV